MIESNFSTIRQAAMVAFHAAHQELGAPKDYTFEDFEHALIIDLVGQVEKNDLTCLAEDEDMAAYSLLIKFGLRDMRDGVDNDSSDELIPIISSYIKKQAH